MNSGWARRGEGNAPLPLIPAGPWPCEAHIKDMIMVGPLSPMPVRPCSCPSLVLELKGKPEGTQQRLQAPGSGLQARVRRTQP